MATTQRVQRCYFIERSAGVFLLVGLNLYLTGESVLRTGLALFCLGSALDWRGTAGQEGSHGHLCSKYTSASCHLINLARSEMKRVGS